MVDVRNLDHDSLTQLANEHGTPLLVFSRMTFEESYRTLDTCLPQAKLMYAVKANPHQGILELVKEMGGGFDIATIEELELVRSIGGPIEEMIYTHPIKSREEIAIMNKLGINRFFFDNADELIKIADAAPGSEVVIRVAVFNPDCVVNLGLKFGAEMDNVIPLLEKAIDYGLDPCGIAFHVGSQSKNPYVYVETLINLKSILDQLTLKGVKLDIVDIGGGFPIRYLEPIMPIEKFCEPITMVLNNYYQNYRILAEPGRYLAGPSSILLTRVVGKATRQDINWYYIDDGVYGSFSGAVFDHAKYRIIALKEDKQQHAVLAGPTCDSFDIILRDALLPELEIGDLLVSYDMGAYTNASSTNFNGRAKTKILSV